MPSPNIKIGSSTYNDISVLTVDRIEGGTADYIYSGLHIKSGAKNVNIYNVPQLRSRIVEQRKTDVVNISCSPLQRIESVITRPTLNRVINISITKE